LLPSDVAENNIITQEPLRIDKNVRELTILADYPRVDKSNLRRNSIAPRSSSVALDMIREEEVSGIEPAQPFIKRQLSISDKDNLLTR
jgi:hypothetical protein